MKRAFALLLALAATGIVVTAGSATPRSGALHVTKECSHYTGGAGSFCTITSSSINTIRPGSRVVYASAVNFATGVLNSDLVIDGPGNNDAFGHVVLALFDLHRHGHVLRRDRRVQTVPHGTARSRVSGLPRVFLGWPVQLRPGPGELTTASCQARRRAAPTA